MHTEHLVVLVGDLEPLFQLLEDGRVGRLAVPPFRMRSAAVTQILRHFRPRRGGGGGGAVVEVSVSSSVPDRIKGDTVARPSDIRKLPPTKS